MLVHVENLPSDFYKRKEAHLLFLKVSHVKAKIVTVGVEFRTQKFLGTSLGTRAIFRHEKTPKVTSKYTKMFFRNYEIVTRFHKKNEISKLATFS